jgi:hypothetical protein
LSWAFFPEEAVADNRERATIRQRTFLNARISYGDGAISTECTVIQLSAKGAQSWCPRSTVTFA